MKERPIIFSADMVRAILEGRKTQTRRVVKGLGSKLGDEYMTELSNGERVETVTLCPYGQPGDRLWVKETWMPDAPRDGTWDDTVFYGCKGSPLSWIPDRFREPAHCLFRASWAESPLTGWRSSRFMPRWASRITLEIVNVRVERVQDISEDDAQAEGVDWSRWTSAIVPFVNLWNTINAKRGYDWDSNPWVWVIEFKQVTA